jgi:MarR family transcriptional repressor of emrRAB
MHTSVRDVNVVGAFAVVLQDLVADAADLAGGPTPATALIAVGGRATGASIDALARILGLSHSGTVRLVDRLERDSLVERRRGADQRSAALVLTPAGRRLARRVLERRAANLHAALALLTDGQRGALLEIAARVVGEMRSDERRICRLCHVEACGRPRGTCPAVALSR